MEVPFVDLKAQAAELLEQYEQVFRSVVERAAFTLGPETGAFEAAFAESCGCAHCVGVSSGTDALKLAYLAVGVGAGDEVIVPANTFIATAEAASHLGAVPVFVDCLEDATIDPGGIERAITARTRAIAPVHLFGQPAHMDAIVSIASEHGIPIVEDACQAHGALYHGRPCGSLGDAAAFSFYPGKNLGALGDGGAVTTNDTTVAEVVRLLRNHGQSDKYTHAAVGYCDRLHNLQAGFLGVKLPYLAAWNEARRAAAARYDRLIEPIEGVTPVGSREGVEHAYHLYVVRSRSRDEVRESLAESGIETGIHYPVPLHLTPAYASLGHGPGDFPVAERLAAEILSLPMHPYLSDGQVEFVAERLAEAVSR